MNQNLINQFDSWIESFQVCHQIQGVAMEVDYDAEFTSECLQGEPNEEGRCHWKPVLRQTTADFSGLESALELELHPDIKLFYGRYWSEHLTARSQRGGLQLLQAWNQDDFEGLLQNIIGHILMKRKLEQAITVFIGVTDEEDFVLSMNNETGQIMLEQVGLEPKEALAPNLAEFLAQVTPEC